MATAVMSQYVAHLDTKKRLTIRGSLAEFFAVKVFADGHVLLEPRMLVDPATVSKRTLRMMDRSIASLKNQKASPAIDLGKYR